MSDFNLFINHQFLLVLDNQQGQWQKGEFSNWSVDHLVAVGGVNILYLVLPMFEVPVPKSEVPNFGTSYVWCFLLLRSYLCVFLSLCYSINGGAP